MKLILDPGTTIRFAGIDGTFNIRGIVGRGSSSVVYLSQYSSSTGTHAEYLLKEYNPEYLILHRDAQGVLSSPQSAAFQEGLERFLASTFVQAQIRLIAGLKNSTSLLQGKYEAYGTGYMVMPVFDGHTYENVTDASPLDTYKTVRTLTEVIRKYHDAGYLHLDIKPSNIFIYPETREMILLFDFDSVTPKEQIRTAKLLSYSQNWAASEQLISSYHHKICEATDLFAIGEILFYRIMGRHSEINERRPFSIYSFPENIRKRDQIKLTEIFRHTLCANVRRRWQTAQELLEKLDDLVAEQELVSTHLVPIEPFIGRERELDEIARRLKSNRILILSGIGGIGKTELAKHYADSHHKDYYDVIVSATFDGSWLSLIVNDSIIKITHFERFPQESPEEYFFRKISKLRELCSARVLFLLDNVDTSVFEDKESGFWKEIISLDCHFLITSRATDWEYPVLEVMPLHDEDDLLKLFKIWYPTDDTHKDAILALIRHFQGHTMALELTAKQIRSGFGTPELMLNRLNSGALTQSGNERIKAVKDGIGRVAPAFEHVKALFDLSALDVIEREILSDLALIPPSGVEGALFIGWCNYDRSEIVDAISSLERTGWLQRADTRISVHPLVGEVILSSVQLDFSYLKEIEKFLRQQSAAGHSSERYNAESLGLWCGHQLERHRVEAKEVYELYLTLSRALQFDHRCREAMCFANRALALSGLFWGKDSLKCCAPHNSVGALSEYVGNYSEARYHFEEAKRIMLVNRIDDSLEIARILINLGTVSHKQGDTPGALSYYQEALNIASKNNDSKTLSNVSYNIGRLYIDSCCFDKAEDFLNRAKDALQGSQNEQVILLSKIEIVFSDLYYLKGDYKASTEHIQNALNLQLQVFGDKHYALSACYSHLGRLCLQKNDFQGAIDYYQKTLEIYETTLPPAHNDIILMHANLASAAYKSKNYQLSEHEFNFALKLSEEKDSSASERTKVIIYNGLAAVYREQEKYERAKATGEKALSICRASIGDHNTTAATVLMTLGKIEERRGDYPAAICDVKEALKIRTEIWGHSPLLTETKFFLVQVLIENKQKREALDLLHEVLKDVTTSPLTSIPSETELINTMLSIALDLNLSDEYAELKARLQNKQSNIDYSQS